MPAKLAIALAVFLLPALASAQPAVLEASAPDRRDSSITVSLIDAVPLVSTTLELSWEQRISPKLSASAVLAAGLPMSSWGDTSSFGKIAQVGGRGDYYLLGDFEAGISIGTELMAARVDDGYDHTFYVASLGGHLSAKYVRRSGTTWGARGGLLTAFSSEPVQVDYLLSRMLYGAGDDSRVSNNPFFTIFVGRSF